MALVQKLRFEERAVEIQLRFAVRPEIVGVAHGIGWQTWQQSRLHQFSHARWAPARPLLKFIRERIELLAILSGA